ncbi:peptide/nickel transport system permease protein [Halanaerobium saccharolyticum]|uniref:Peptide/nickel transport system permease protein n=1 Tax=Halanaerobium saccharolyticum TaxID=43595 RepID=A0A4R6M1T1_9FIRM|nr:ABC transporter permease [Halanaerobium saccharolyticum]TDO94330.1 peptide/nickel transport system permease protein [Halanaerobium saccharolyticum]
MAESKSSIFKKFLSYIKNIFSKNKKEEYRSLEYASQSQLIWYRFKKHKLASLGLTVLAILYVTSIFAGFVAPYAHTERIDDYKYAPPTEIHVISEENGLRTPFVYSYSKELDTETFQYEYVIDKTKEYSLKLFVKSEPYKLLGFIPMEHKLFGTGDKDAPVFLFGTDNLSRDIFSRILFGGRVSLFVGFGGVFLSFIIGSLLGGISGYFGGVIDEIIMRAVELLMSIPKIPLWIAFSAAVPRDWTAVQTYLAITMILALVGWTGLARVVRGKLMSLKNEQFAMAARAAGASDFRIITKHLLPAFISYLVVHLTLAIPGMILGETTLSFLGLGIQPPAVSWGTLLQDAQDLTVLADYPWHLIPTVFVIVTVLMFNFIGDGLRDAADPYSSK